MSNFKSSIASLLVATAQSITAGQLMYLCCTLFRTECAWRMCSQVLSVGSHGCEQFDTDRDVRFVSLVDCIMEVLADVGPECDTPPNLPRRPPKPPSTNVVELPKP